MSKADNKTVDEWARRIVLHLKGEPADPDPTLIEMLIELRGEGHLSNRVLWRQWALDRAITRTMTGEKSIDEVLQIAERLVQWVFLR